MNKKFRKLILPISIFATTQAYALGLGSLQVNSALDESLSGEITLVLDGSEDIESIKVSLASHADYERVGLDKSYVPPNIIVNMAEKDDQIYIEISSKGPISEPIVSLLLVVDWANGHILREYTLLLDPPLFNSRQTQESYSEPVQTQTYEAPKQIKSTKQTTPQEVEQEAIVNNSFAQSSQVIVESGDTLWEIASRFSGNYRGPQQMMVAIFNLNPPAFHNDDMNLIQKGAILNIPNSDQVSMVSDSQAISEVRSHIQKWSRLQTQDSGVGDIDSQYSVDYGIELVPPNDPDSSESNNSSGLSNNSTNRRVLAELSQAKEDLASSNLENNELSDRIQELEQIVKDQEIALSLKDTNLAQLQQQLKDDTEASSLETTDDVWGDNDDTNTLVESQNNETTEANLANTNASDGTVNNDKISNDTTVSDEPVDDTALAVDNNVNKVDVADTEKKNNISSQKPETTQVQAQEQSLMDKVLNYKYEALIALGVLLLGAFGFIFFKRREHDNESGGFLDSISSNKNNAIVMDDGDFNDGNQNILDSDITELDLSNIEDDFDDADLDQEEDFNIDEEPEVVVMDDQQTNISKTDGFDLDIDEFDLGTHDTDEKGLETDDIEGSNLDFGSDQTKDNEVEEQAISTEEESEDFDLDFDLDDLDLDDDSDEVEDKSSTGRIVEDDFSLDLDMTSDEHSLEELVEDKKDPEDLVLDTGEGNTVMDADKADDSEIKDLEFDLSEDMFSTDDLELDVYDSEETTVTDEATSADDYSLDIELADDDIDLGLDFDDIVDNDAIDTKLDLAKAYFEMGDVEGAKQMVVEIIQEGNDDQKSKAEELKVKIENS